MEEIKQRARNVIDTNKYLTLATVGADGQPWATPVFFTPDGYSTLYWASGPDTRHSVNIARDSRVGITVFDSSVPIGGAQAVYMQASAAIVPDDELADRGAFYCGRYPETEAFLEDLLKPDSLFRLYRATVHRHWALVRGGDPTYGTGIDRRLEVDLG